MLYAVPALLFTGGYIAAASTGMAGLVQAGYLTSSVLCISAFLCFQASFARASNRRVTKLRFSIWSRVASYSPSRKHPRYPRCWLWNPRLPPRSGIPARGPDPIRRRRRNRRDNWRHHRTAHHADRAPTNGCCAALCRRSRRGVDKYRKRAYGCDAPDDAASCHGVLGRVDRCVVHVLTLNSNLTRSQAGLRSRAPLSPSSSWQDV